MNVKQLLSPNELEHISQRSNWRGLWLLLCNFSIAIGAFVLAAIYPNPVTVVLAIFLLGSRQLGFGVLMHECGHNSLMTTRPLNKFVGLWLAAPWTFGNMPAYRSAHLEHHRAAGTKNDPDLANYQDYPTTKKSIHRKMFRDITGQTGWKQSKGIYYNLRRIRTLSSEARHALVRGLAVNIALLGLFIAIGHAWLYLLWMVAFFTTYRLLSRIRQVGEHGAVEDLFDVDPRLHTRTIRASWLARLFICPLGVSYHMEHHLMASVPIYRLPLMHKLLTEKGAYDEVSMIQRYTQLYQHVTAKAAQAAA